MRAYTCDRCGKLLDRREAQLKLILDKVQTHNVDLCENCYQTIKEVLENGEVK